MLVTLFLMGYVVPRFSSIYEQLGSDLPFASRLLLQWGQMLEAHTMTVIVVGGARGGRHRLWTVAPLARAPLFGTWFAKVPAIGRQLRLYQLARLYRTVGMLLRSGMPAVTAMNMSSGLLSEGAASRLLPRRRNRSAKVSRSPMRWNVKGSPRRWRRACCASASAAATWVR